MEVITPDRRFSVTRPYQRLWNLHIDNVKMSDAGEYTCNIQTNPPQAKKVTLEVQGESDTDINKSVNIKKSYLRYNPHGDSEHVAFVITFETKKVALQVKLS